MMLLEGVANTTFTHKEKQVKIVLIIYAVGCILIRTYFGVDQGCTSIDRDCVGGTILMVATIRKADENDIESLAELIQFYAQQGIMLPRSREVLAKQIEHFVVAEWEGELIGCGSLCQLGADLVEIRSLGISPDYKGRGIGTMLVDELLIEAKARAIPKVMALTYESKFFQKNGFDIVEKEIFPEKVWTDCIHCSKLHCCDEIAVMKVLD